MISTGFPLYIEKMLSMHGNTIITKKVIKRFGKNAIMEHLKERGFNVEMHDAFTQSFGRNQKECKKDDHIIVQLVELKNKFEELHEKREIFEQDELPQPIPDEKEPHRLYKKKSGPRCATYFIRDVNGDVAAVGTAKELSEKLRITECSFRKYYADTKKGKRNGTYQIFRA